jgi:hypothetical protein
MRYDYFGESKYYVLFLTKSETSVEHLLSY